MRVVPMLQVADVEVSSRWFQDVLGLTSGHGGDEFEMLFAGEPFASALEPAGPPPRADVARSQRVRRGDPHPL